MLLTLCDDSNQTQNSIMLQYLDSDITDFIQVHVTTFLAWDILVYFHKNPDTSMAADDLAIKLGRRGGDVESAADELVEKSVLTKEDAVYKYCASKETRAMVGKFVEALNHREKRLLILTAVLQNR